MRKTRAPILAYAIILCVHPIVAHAAPSAALSVGIVPSLQIPIGAGAADYSIGGSGGSYLCYDLEKPAGLFLRGGFDYAYAPYVGGNSLSLMAVEAIAGYSFGFAPRLRLEAFGGGGYNYGLKNGASGVGGGSLYLHGALGLDLLLTPGMGLAIGGSYRSYMGLYSTAGVWLATTFFLSGQEERRSRIKAAAPVDVELLKGFKVAPAGKGLSIEGASFAPIFPVFRKYYDEHAIGSIRLRNNEKSPIEEASVSFFVKEYMDSPKTAGVGRIDAGATAEVPILALFTDRVLEVTEATKAAAEITAEYRMGGDPYRAQLTESLRVLDRNAMTWDDDRRPAAFVTTKDPAVLTFSKNVSSLVRDAKIQGINPKMLAAMALHDALGLHGLAYVIDPTSSYADKTGNKAAPDFLQFPRQTLQYKAGDCDDLSILNCALLESIGIETAFITVPGHIYIAISLGISSAEARKTFSTTDDLILRDDAAWLPVEITDIANGFIHAWKQGAKEWRESSSKGEARIYPLHEAWATYEAVALPGNPLDIAMPSSDKLLAAIAKEAAAFVDGEISFLAKPIEAAIKSAQDDREARNRLGMLFARYGRLDRAAAEFAGATATKEYMPALYNLGNISFLNGDWTGAKDYFERAAKLAPTNPRMLLGVSRAAFELEDFKTATECFAKVKALDPGLAESYAYLGAQDSQSATRAGEASARKEAVLWEGQ